MNEKMLEAFGDDEFIAKISGLDNYDAIKEAFIDRGCTLDFEQLKSKIDNVSSEFTEDELEDVSGGGIFKSAWSFGKALGIVGRSLYEDSRGSGRSYTSKQVGWAIGYIDRFNPFK